MEENDFDYIAAEAREQQILLDKGITFTAGNVEYLIKQPVLGQLDKLSELFLKLDLNKEKLASENSMEIFEEQKRMIGKNARLLARIIAIAAVDHIGVPRGMWERLLKRVRINFLVRKYTEQIYWNVRPSDLMKLTTIIFKASNLSDFSASIALLSVNRTTAPQAIED